MNDAQSTIAGLKAQDCPGGGWNGMPTEIERATVADCLAHGVCGCIYGDAVQHIERLRALAAEAVAAWDYGSVEGCRFVVWQDRMRATINAMRAADAAATATKVDRLKGIVNAPLAPGEMRLVDKHCDWIAFQHAWNAVMKGRREAIADEQSENGK